MRTEATEHRWRTGDEMDFIRRLGEHCHRDTYAREGDPGERRVKLLAGYLRGCARRSDWGEIDQGAAEAYARRLLFSFDVDERLQRAES